MTPFLTTLGTPTFNERAPAIKRAMKEAPLTARPQPRDRLFDVVRSRPVRDAKLDLVISDSWRNGLQGSALPLLFAQKIADESDLTSCLIR